MLFKTITLTALASLVAADYAAIAASLSLISADTAKLNNDLTAYNGNILLAVPVLGDNVKLNSDLINGTSIANGSEQLSAGDAINLVAPVQSLAGQVNVTLQNLINKYPTFKSSNLDGIVLGTLTITRGNSKDYSNAIISKVPTDLQAVAQNIAAPIDAAFVQAIAVYQGGAQ